MKEQNYNSHTKYYAPHHFIFYPIVLTSAGVSFYYIFKQPDNALIWTAFTGIFLLLAWLSFMLRQHYALSNQNRIVRVELRLRYYILTQKNFEPLEQQLKFSQLAALRFASDEEFIDLLNKALHENWSSGHIKKEIKNWKPDHMRV